MMTMAIVALYSFCRMYAGIINIKHIIMAQAAVHALKAFIMRKIIRSLKVGVTVNAFMICVNGLRQRCGIDVHGSLTAVPFRCQSLIVMTGETVISSLREQKLSADEQREQ